VSRKIPVLEAREFSVRFGERAALKDINVEFYEREIAAIVGPTGSGKSALLRAFNRMNDEQSRHRFAGRVLYRGQDLYAEGIDPVEVRLRIGMLFPEPQPFPRSVFHNVAWAVSLHGMAWGSELDHLVEVALTQVDLWESLRDRLFTPTLELPDEVQQRICLARALALEPDILLLDNPTWQLDRESTARFEELLLRLQERYTLVLVTSDPQQAARISRRVCFLDRGELIEHGLTDQMFTRPRDARTEAYLTGRSV